jgi:hypothetical protein
MLRDSSLEEGERAAEAGKLGPRDFALHFH